MKTFCIIMMIFFAICCLYKFIHKKYITLDKVVQEETNEFDGIRYVVKKKRFGKLITKKFDQNGNLIYYEKSDGYWIMYKYDVFGYEICRGFWKKQQRDRKGRIIYLEDSTGFWKRWVYDKFGNLRRTFEGKKVEKVD